MSSQFTNKEIDDAIFFILKDNPGKSWTNEELADAVNNFLMENAVVRDIEILLSKGLIEEVSPNRFATTKKGDEYYKSITNKEEDTK